MYSFFFFNDTATTEIYTLSLHDALPISMRIVYASFSPGLRWNEQYAQLAEHTLVRLRCRLTLNITRSPFISVRLWCANRPDRKSTRLNSSHANISYAVFCLKKKKKTSTI